MLMLAFLSRLGVTQKSLIYQPRKFKHQSLKTGKIGCTSNPTTIHLMTLRSDGRRVLSATMQPDLYDRVYAHCKKMDIPITVFVREALKQALPPAGDAEPA